MTVLSKMTSNLRLPLLECKPTHGSNVRTSFIDINGLLLKTLLLCVIFLAGCVFTDTERYISDLKSENVVAQRDAIFWLGEKKKKAAVSPLMDLLAIQRPKVIRLEAIIALGKIGASDPVDRLISILEETDNDILVAVIEALGKIEDPKAVKPIADLLTNNALRNGAARITAIWALGNIGDRNAIPILTRLSGESDRFIAANASIALKQIGAKR